MLGLGASRADAQGWRSRAGAHIGAVGTPSQERSAIAVGLVGAHRRRARNRGMLYFLRQLGANAPTMEIGRPPIRMRGADREIFFLSNLIVLLRHSFR